MKTYSEFAPSGFDTRGLGLTDRGVDLYVGDDGKVDS